jgi:pheromone shutdown protein TraB
MNNAKKILMAGCVALIGMLGGLIVSGCATTTQEITYSYPTPTDILALMEDWDRIEKETKIYNNRLREQYAKALVELSNAIAEGERWRARAENK